MANCININDAQYKELLEQSKLNPLILKARISIFQDKNGLDSYPKVEDIIKSNEVNQTLKAVDILQSDKAKQVFDKGNKNGWDLNKILTELQVPKEQKALLLDLNITDREQLALELASRYSYSVEVNTTKKQEAQFNNVDDLFGDGNYKELEENTDYYSNLTVPGGTNYTEQEISTPLITPSIKGHAQFSTDNGIGWFRSDIQAVELSAQNAATNNKGNLTPFDNDYGKVPTKTRRILEVQSDLFQKGRGKKELTGQDVPADEFSGMLMSAPEGIDIEPEFKRINESKTGNQFLQLLNKDSNWVTFFVKSIVQDSVKKGYEKVLFPSGNTASKVEGHTTLEEFKKQKEDRLNGLLSAKIVEKEFESYDENTGETEILPFRVEYNENGKQYSLPYKTKEDAQKNIDSYKIEISQLKQELERVEGPEGFAALKPIYNFYENTVTNILNKTYGKENVKVITDEHGNTWNEIELEENRDNSTIFMKKIDFSDLIGSKKNEVVSDKTQEITKVDSKKVNLETNKSMLFGDKSLKDSFTSTEVLQNIIDSNLDLSNSALDLIGKATKLLRNSRTRVKVISQEQFDKMTKNSKGD